jgi:inosose dehydratase
MSIKIGTAPSSWGVWFASDPKQIPWQRFLDEVVEAGYEWVELGPYGYLPTDLSRLRTELDGRGLRVPAAHASGNLPVSSQWRDLEKEVMGAGELLVGLGAEYLILLEDTYIDRLTDQPKGPTRLDDQAWQRLIGTVNRVAEVVRDKFGLKLLFEPHTDTHVEYEDQIEAFLQQTDPARVSLLLDVGHYTNRGGDPVAFMRRHHKRIPYLHLKDIDPKLQEKFGSGDLSFAAAVGMGLWCELSEGTVDFVALADVLNEVGFDGWVAVEQGMYPAPFDKPLPIAKRNRTYLREIGIG